MFLFKRRGFNPRLVDTSIRLTSFQCAGNADTAPVMQRHELWQRFAILIDPSAQPGVNASQSRRPSLPPQSSEARRGFAGVSGQRPEQGAMPSFLRGRKRGHKALTLHSESLLLPRCW